MRKKREGKMERIISNRIKNRSRIFIKSQNCK